jgi:hypothetical protein
MPLKILHSDMQGMGTIMEILRNLGIDFFCIGLLTYLRSWALPEELPIVQPFRKFPAILRNPKVPVGVWEQGAEENIWTEERWSDGRLEETA